VRMARLSSLFFVLGALAATAYGTCSNKRWFCGTRNLVTKNFCDDLQNKIDCRYTCDLCNGNNNNNNNNCGISKVSQSRIVNGDEAKPGSWPWMVSLKMNGRHFCGGTIISPKWVMTASHCISSFRSPRGMTITVGAHDISKVESSQQTVTVKRMIMHQDYNRKSMEADIALLELSSPVRFNDRVVVPCMPNQYKYPSAGKRCVVAGWGVTSHVGSTRTATLQQTILPVVESPHKGCHQNTEVVCVGNGFDTRPDGSQHANACRGDSGGPLVCQENGKWSVEGVASYVHTYCKYYTAYAPVNKYLGWLKRYVPTL